MFLLTRPECFDRHQSVNFASFIDAEFARVLAIMLGGIPVVRPDSNALIPINPDCVELGPVRVIGGIRPQNFDAAYRPYTISLRTRLFYCSYPQTCSR